MKNELTDTIEKKVFCFIMDLPESSSNKKTESAIFFKLLNLFMGRFEAKLCKTSLPIPSGFSGRFLAKLPSRQGFPAAPHRQWEGRIHRV